MAPENRESVRAGVDAAWRIHDAQGDWNGKVDAKASFAFAIQSAAIATVIGLTSDGRLFSNAQQGRLQVIYAVGLILLVIAAGFASVVVIPKLRGRATLKSESSDSFVYFGHARYWDAEELEKRLRTDDMLPQLSRQIVVVANITWRKHVLVQISFITAIAGALVLVALAAYLVI